MAVEITQLAGEAIHVFRFVPPSEPMAEIQKLQSYMQTAARSPGGKLYTIADFTQTDLSFSGAVIGLAEMSKYMDGPGLQMDGAMVGTSEMVKLMSEAGQQEQYGSRRIPFFPTLDEAVAHVRTLIAAE